MKNKGIIPSILESKPVEVSGSTIDYNSVKEWMESVFSGVETKKPRMIYHIPTQKYLTIDDFVELFPVGSKEFYELLIEEIRIEYEKHPMKEYMSFETYLHIKNMCAAKPLNK